MSRFITHIAGLFLCSTFLLSCATTKQTTLLASYVARPTDQLFESVVRITTVSADPICDTSDPPKCVPSPTILSSGALIITPNGSRGILTVAHALTVFGPDQRTEVYATLGNDVTIQIKDSACDFAADICFMFVPTGTLEDEGLSVLKLAEEAPEWGDRILYTGDPKSISTNFRGQIRPLFSGLFSGSSVWATPWGPRKISMVTIPSAHGASGSVLVNERYEIIGVVQMVHPTFAFSTLTIEFNDLVAFLNSVKTIEEYRSE